MPEARRLPWGKSRKFRTREPNKRVLIYCNGAQTEKNYFESLQASLRLPSVTVEVIPSGNSRLSLVGFVLRDLKEKGITIKAGDVAVWVVFDVDSLPKGGGNNPAAIAAQADAAQKFCREKNLGPIVSNECFELWFYLHFHYCSSHLHRDQLYKKLKSLCGGSYKKTDAMFEALQDKLSVAMRHAETLCRQYEPGTPVSRCTPYTNVHELVKYLQALQPAPGEPSE